MEINHIISFSVQFTDGTVKSLNKVGYEIINLGISGPDKLNRMIRSKEDYNYYLEADRKALFKKARKPRPFTDDVWRFQRSLRALEFYKNCKHGLWGRLFTLFFKFRYHRLSVKLGFTIPPNVFGPGLSIAHWGALCVHENVRVGANCRIHICVNIGASAGNPNDVPKIGNNVYIGPGAKIFGNIEIADGIAIGANAVVNRSFTEPHITIAGVPACKVSDKGSAGLLMQGAE